MPSRKPPPLPPAKVKRDARTLSNLAAPPAKQPTSGRRDRPSQPKRGPK